MFISCSCVFHNDSSVKRATAEAKVSTVTPSYAAWFGLYFYYLAHQTLRRYCVCRSHVKSTWLFIGCHFKPRWLWNEGEYWDKAHYRLIIQWYVLSQGWPTICHREPKVCRLSFQQISSAGDCADEFFPSIWRMLISGSLVGMKTCSTWLATLVLQHAVV